MFRTAWLVMLVACGRLNFATSGDDGGVGDGSVTGPRGARYLIELDANATTPEIAGSLGRVAVLEGFQGGTTIAGIALPGQAMYASSGFVWIDPSGAAATSTVLDSTSICQIRTLGSTLADGVLAAGHSEATQDMPAFGPCSIATSRQDGITIAVDPAATQALVADVESSSFNIQTWYASGLADGNVVVSGIYGGAGKLGMTALPVAGSDENSFYARVDPATHDASWVVSVSSADDLGAGPIDPDGDDVCATGEFSGTLTVFGTSLTAVGSHDAWIARFDRNGNARFVRGIGSSGLETTGSVSTIAATSDGGCTIALPVPGDLAIDGLVLPASQATSVIVRFDAQGTAVAGERLGGALQLARLGDQIYGALPCSGAACKLADVTYTPLGDDIAIASFDAALHATVISALTGGATALDKLAAIRPDGLALAITTSATPTMFGTLSLSPATPVNALALFGVDP